MWGTIGELLIVLLGLFMIVKGLREHAEDKRIERDLREHGWFDR